MYTQFHTPKQYYETFKSHVDSKVFSYVSSLECKLSASKAEIDKLKQEIKDSGEEFANKLKEEISIKIEKDIVPLQNNIEKLNVNLNDAKTVIISQNQTLIEKEKELKKIEKENAKLKEELERLKNRNRKDSKTSSMPSSTNSPYKKVIKNSRAKTNKKKGGQLNHAYNAHVFDDNPTEIIEHKQCTCDCGGSINYSDKPIRTQEFDIEFNAKVTENKFYTGVCPNCGKKHNNGLKKHQVMSPVSFGRNLESYIVYLSSVGMVSLNRIKKTIYEMSNCLITVSEAQILNILNKYANEIDKNKEEVVNSLLSSKCLHVDESPLKYQASLLWATSLTDGTNYLLFSNDEKGHKISKELFDILMRYTGTLVHDHFMFYYSFENCSHAECNAHILRGLEYCYSYELHKSSGLLKDLFLETYMKVKEKIPIVYELEKAKYITIITEALKDYDLKEKSFNKPEWVNLFKRIEKYIDNHLLFVKDPNVPFTNNIAESSLRMFKTKQKVSGRFYSRTAIESNLTLRAFINSNRNINLLSSFNNLFK
jgi:hypothetical protein